MPPATRPVVLVPTYNERDNVEAILEAILEQPGALDVCVVDDASPDGTGELADARAAEEPRVHVLHRAGKQGLGRAYIDAFRWALAAPAEYTHIIQMDADFSHDPSYLGPMLEAAEEADLVIGSRWVEGGGVTGWGIHRRALSQGGSFYARTVLGLPVRDVTAGFACWRRAALASIDLDGVAANGYAFQIEMKYRAHRKGLRLREIPIVFPDRERGTSKMSLQIVWEGAWSVLRLRQKGAP